MKERVILSFRLSKHSSENMMSLDNISIAFGSTLMKSATAEGGATVADVSFQYLDQFTII